MKKFVSIFAMALLAFLLPAGVEAAQVPLVEVGSAVKLVANSASYVPYEGASYELMYEENSDGTLTITGYTGTDEGELVLPESIDGKAVTEIGVSAFANSTGFVGDLVIPDSVTIICPGAFNNCTGFNGSLYLGTSVKVIADNYSFDGWCWDLDLNKQGVFAGCSGFKGDLIIPNTVEEIGAYSFYKCSGFNGNLILGKGVKEIDYNSFYGCVSLKGELSIPNSTITIGSGAFYNCIGLNGNLKLGSNLQIIGSGPYETGVFEGCAGLTGKLIIPDSVTTIGENTFSDCRGFSGDIVIPDSVEKLGRLAFDGCSGFDGNLLIGAGLSAIEPRTFLGCSGLSGKLEIGENVKTIGYLAFSDCCNLSGDLIVPESVLKIDAGAFENCLKFTSLKLSENLSEIGGVIYTYSGGRYDGAFQGCSGFQGILHIPDKIETLPNAAFADCSGFTGLILPRELKAIGSKDNRDYDTKGTFEGCIGFTCELVIPETVTVIEPGAFSDCSGFTGDLTIPDSVTKIGYQAFQGCSGFTGSLTIGNNVTEIGDCAFKDCSEFTGGLTIGNSVTSIGGDAFYGCSGFTGSLVIPDSVMKVGYQAFQGCSGFTGCLVIPDSITEIWSETFKGCSGFTGNLTIPNSVTEIGYDAFYGCTGFSGNLVIPDSVTNIGSSAFSGCSGFTDSLVIGNSVTTIKTKTFSGCSGLTGNLTIGDNVTEIGSYAFENCNGFSGVMTIGKGLKNIYGLPCSNTGFTEFIVHPENEHFSSYDGIIYNKKKTEIVSAPKGKTGELKLPNSLQSIPSSCFSDFGALTGSLIIPNSVTEIGSAAFAGCSGLTGNLTIPNGVTEIGDNAFSGCNGFMGSLTIPDSVTTIGDDAFKNCSGFGSVTMPESVTEIGIRAFDGCTSLKAVYYGGNEAQWNNISISSGNDPLKNASIRYDTYVTNGDDSVPESGTVISLTKDRYTFTVGTQGTISANMTSPNLSDSELSTLRVTLESSDESVLTLQPILEPRLVMFGYCSISKEAIPHKAGTVTVTAKTADGAESKRTVTVMAPGNAIEMDKRTYVLEQGKSLPFFASVSNDNNSFCSWSSSNANVVSVTEDGGDIEVMHPIEPTSVFSDRIVLYANNPGTATITCRLDSGQSASKTITVKTAAELAHERAEEAVTSNHYNTPVVSVKPGTVKAIEKKKDAWEKAIQEYLKQLSDSVYSKMNASGENANRDTVIKAQATSMMETDKTSYSRNLSFPYDVPDAWKPYVYQAYATALYDHVATTISLSGISPTIANEAQIVNEVAKSIKQVDETYSYTVMDSKGKKLGKIELHADFLIANGLKCGSITCRDCSNRKKTYLVSVNSRLDEAKAVVSGYLGEMTEMEKHALQNVYSGFFQDLSGTSLSKLTQKYLNMKIKNKTEKQLQLLGLGKVKVTLGALHDYAENVNSMMERAKAGDISVVQDIYSMMTNTDFEYDEIFDKAVKKKASKLEKAVKKLEDAIFDYIYKNAPKQRMRTIVAESQEIELQNRFRIQICGPISIELFDESGTKVATINEEEIWSDDMEIELEEGGNSKTISVPLGKRIAVKIIGEDFGILNCSFEKIADGDPVGRANFYDILMEPGKEITTSLQKDSEESLQSLTMCFDNVQMEPNEYISVVQDACVEVSAMPGLEERGYIIGNGDYTRGDVVALSAIPNTGYQFTGWYDGDIWISSDSVYEFAAKEDIALTARFSKIECTLANDLIAISSEYQDICTAFAEETENQFVLHLKPLEGKTLPAVTAYLAIYNSDGKMIDIRTLSKKEVADGIDFSGTAPKENCKLFALDSRYHPVLVAYSNIR